MLKASRTPDLTLTHGYLVFGVANTDTALVGVDQEPVEGVIAKLKNPGRDERCRSNFSS